MRNVEIKINDLVTKGLVVLNDNEYIRDITRTQKTPTGDVFYAEVENASWIRKD